MANLANRKYSKGAGTGNLSVSLDLTPAANNAAAGIAAFGPSILQIDHISGYFQASTITAVPTNVIIQIADQSSVAQFVQRINIVANSTLQPIPFNIVFPEGTGPRFQDDNGTGATATLAAGNGSVALGAGFIGIGYHVDPN